MALTIAFISEDIEPTALQNAAAVIAKTIGSRKVVGIYTPPERLPLQHAVNLAKAFGALARAHRPDVLISEELGKWSDLPEEFTREILLKRHRSEAGTFIGIADSVAISRNIAALHKGVAAVSRFELPGKVVIMNFHDAHNWGGVERWRPQLDIL